MPTECINSLNIKPNGYYLDATAGGGGHSFLIAPHLTTGRLISADRDAEAVQAASDRLKDFPCAEVIRARFSDLPNELKRLNITKLDGILADFGVSSHQIDTAERGFSYMKDAPLDMRMSQSGGITAAQLVNTADETELVKILFEYGEEKHARAIASAIVRARAKKPIKTTFELVDIIDSVTPKKHIGHSSKRTFQALRIAVNNELGEIRSLLEFAVSMLNTGGRLSVLTFHSLEDRLVKRFFTELSVACTCPPDFPVCVCGGKAVARQIPKGGLTATKEELELNPRSHSARLRTIEIL